MRIVISSVLLVGGFAHAGFQLETMTVIVDAGEARKIFNVKNTGHDPILLSTKVSDIEGGQDLAKDIMVSPPITRIEPEQSQQINFVLKKGVNITDEALLRVSFQGVGAAVSNATKMPIRQDVAMLIIPEGMTVSKTPWDALEVKQQGKNLTFTNKGKQVIRLSPNFVGIPSNKSYNLEQFYVRPNETKTVEVDGDLSKIKISPLSRYGFKMNSDEFINVIK